MIEMSGLAMAEFRFICLLDNPETEVGQEIDGAQEDVEDYLPPPDPSDGFDLLTAVPGCVTFTTGVARGRVHLTVQQLDEKPDAILDPQWETVEEITFCALSGHTHVASGEFFPYLMMEPPSFEESVTPAGAGHYRVRAHARNRMKATFEHLEDADPPTDEHYLLQVWPTDPSPANQRRLHGPAMLLWDV